MKRHTFTAILILMTVSVVGIGALEWYWVSSLMREQREAFAKSVQQASGEIIAELEKGATELLIEEFLGGGSAGNAVWNFNYSTSAGDTHKVIKIDTTMVGEKGRVSRKVVIVEAGGQVKQEYIEGLPGFEIPVDAHFAEATDLAGLARKTDSLSRRYVETSISTISSAMKDVLVRRIGTVPNLQKTLEGRNLDSLVTQKLASHGIEVSARFAFAERPGVPVNPSYTNAPGVDADQFEYRFDMFPGSVSQASLLLDFPGKERSILMSLRWVVLLAVLFSLLMLGTFGATIYHMLKQKKLSEVKTEFINNMTHEFKTPLATIGLAADSIRHPQVSDKPGEVARYTEIITREKRRLTDHVERILQMARMERGELPLQRVSLDLVQVARKAAEAMQMQAAESGGVLILNMPENAIRISGDETHLLNAITNLIDNGLKYCHRSPEVTVSVNITYGMARCTVTDNGIGMSPEVQKKAFKTFYRATSGDVHNVKGFGLGLSYVREVVHGHGGTLILKSTPGAGSTVGFEIPAMA